MRSSGVLLHITSLPSTYGVGTLEQASRFIGFLKKSKQSYWQILPVTPTDFVNSPYASPSAFAGNTLLIDVAQLQKQGLISVETLKSCRKMRGNNYGYAIDNKEKMLREAFVNFTKTQQPADYLQFVVSNEFWLEDYALFCAVKRYFNGKSWLEWDDENIRMRDPATVKNYAEMLKEDVEYTKFCQYVFFKQWKQFRAKLKRANIKLIGDIPIYVAYDSADVWAHSELFELTFDRRPSWVAGVPPDYFSADGQLWGNPLYNWQAMQKENYHWWTMRVKKCAELFDVLRIDHFRAFDSYYAIAYGEKTARNGHWRTGIGYEFLQHLQTSVPDLTIIAEDLGDIPQSVLDLRDRCGLAGMKVVQFGFDGNPQNAFLPQNFEEHCVAYLGTHDNDTTQGWWDSLTQDARNTVLRLTNLQSGDHIALELLQKLANSRAELVVYCLQDLTEKDTASRMNTPGTLGCWKYMATSKEFSADVAKWLADLTEKVNRA